jgi:UDP-N-acetylmuramoyl-tripeptide--D-alanyl-D-alanine ligase
VTPASGAALAGGLVVTLAAGLRWLRVAQREHYLGGSVSRFAVRWWRSTPSNVALFVLGLTGVALAFVWPLAALLTAAAMAAGPVGLPLRGRTTPLAWTRRARTLAGVTALLVVAVVTSTSLLGREGTVAAVGAAVPLLVPLFVDAACLLTAPVEDVLSRRHVDSARAVLARVGPVVVAVTGSFGKTSTKLYIAHLVGCRKSVVASPASYNNRAGLARTVNEHLARDTEVLVAEMGAYGPGEIADLCSWLEPQIAVITAIGPAHLERFRTEDRIVAAKAEILEGAAVGVLNVDDARLAELAVTATGRGTRVVRCSAIDRSADVCVLGDDRSTMVLMGGKTMASLGALTAPLTNVACAVAVALELGVAVESIARMLPSLPKAANRLEVGRSPAGVIVIDDTYNSNPAGARVALQTLARHATDGSRRVVVTPGMVELGSRQAAENSEFAAEASSVATDLVIVGRTNRRALRAGSGRSRPGVRVIALANREQAVEWVRSSLAEGDVVLYENDLPDHFS